MCVYIYRYTYICFYVCVHVCVEPLKQSLTRNAILISGTRSRECIQHLCAYVRVRVRVRVCVVYVCCYIHTQICEITHQRSNMCVCESERAYVCGSVYVPP